MGQDVTTKVQVELSNVSASTQMLAKQQASQDLVKTWVFNLLNYRVRLSNEIKLELKPISEWYQAC